MNMNILIIILLWFVIGYITKIGFHYFIFRKSLVSMSLHNLKTHILLFGPIFFIGLIITLCLIQFEKFGIKF